MNSKASEEDPVAKAPCPGDEWMTTTAVRPAGALAA